MSNIGFLDGYEELPAFAAEVKRHPRTIRRWMNAPDGLPYTRIGNRILVHIPTAREWLLSRMRHPNPRRNSKPNKELGAFATPIGGSAAAGR